MSAHHLLRQEAAMAVPSPSATHSQPHLSHVDHPLALELASLRTSLAKFQHVAHTTSMQLQGKVMELMMIREEEGKWREEKRVLDLEVESLRARLLSEISHSDSASDPSSSSGSQAMAELILAHRRLSAKLDVQEQSHAETSRILTECEAENEYIKKERENLEVMILDWKDRLLQRESEAEQHKATIRRLEEEKRLFIAALQVAGVPIPVSDVTEDEPSVDVVTSSGTTANEKSQEYFMSLPTPPATADEDASLHQPSYKPHICPTCSAAGASTSNASAAVLEGLQGVRQLFSDFQEAATQRQSRISQLELELEESENVKQAAEEQARADRAAKDGLEIELRSLKADDESASRVVERYMAFTQKTAQQLYTNMQSQSAQLGQVIKTLRHQLLASQTLLNRERARSRQLRLGTDELAAGFERETFGRRREVALRLKALEREEARIEDGKRWMDRVRRVRNQIQTTSRSSAPSSPRRQASNPFGTPAKTINGRASPSPSSPSLMANSPASYSYVYDDQTTILWDLLESAVAMLDRHEKEGSDTFGHASQTGVVNDVDSSLARLILAEELAMGLMADLERETKRNIHLEKAVLTKIAGDEGDTEFSMGLEETQDLVPRSHSLISPKTIVAPKMEGPSIAPNDTEPSSDRETQFSAPVEEELSGEETPKLSDNDNSKDSVAVDVMESDIAEVTHLASNDPEVKAILEDLEMLSRRHVMMQKTLHDCAASIVSLRVQASAGPSRQTEPPFSRELAQSYQIVLDSIDDVLADLSVEVEITATDDQRAIAGQRALLAVTSTPTDGSRSERQGSKSLEAVRKFVRESDISWTHKRIGFERKLADIEHDIVKVKMAMMTSATSAEIDEDESAELIAGLDLRTVRVPRLSQLSTSANPGALRSAYDDGSTDSSKSAAQAALGNGLRRGFFPSLGRTLSGTTPSALSGLGRQPSSMWSSSPLQQFAAIPSSPDLQERPSIDLDTDLEDSEDVYESAAESVTDSGHTDEEDDGDESDTGTINGGDHSDPE